MPCIPRPDSMQINNTCIAAGVCYGYAQSRDTRATQAMTDQLLAELPNQIVIGFQRHAVIAGDTSTKSQVPCMKFLDGRRVVGVTCRIANEYH